MTKRRGQSAWVRRIGRSFVLLTRRAMKSSTRAVVAAKIASLRKSAAPLGDGTWTAGVAMGSTGLRRYRLYRPPKLRSDECLPLLVMLHGCGQDANAFATSTRMNRIALRERFLVLYPEQDRLANAHGCWNWFDTASGRAQGEAALIMKAIEQICLLYPVDRACVAIAGLSAGASMAALLATLHPDRFQAVVMHSGVPPGTAHSSMTALGAMLGRRATNPIVATPFAMPAVWPSLLVIHGQSDAVVSSQNGKACAQVWADGVGARAGPARRVQRGKRYAMSVTDFKRKGCTVVSLVEVDKLGHAWSGGAANTPYSEPQGPDASRMVWAFAAKQFRPRAA
jgi:poly(hydroxyalkanoate) depolymerase family esterase